MKYRGFKKNYIKKYTEKNYEEMCYKLIDKDSWESKLFYKYSNNRLGKEQIDEIFEENSEKDGLEMLIQFYCENEVVMMDEDLLEKNLRENNINKGDLIECIHFTLKREHYINDVEIYKVFFSSKVEIKTIKKCIKGENILIVEDVLKRLNGGFFNDWKFSFDKKLGMELYEKENNNYVKTYLNVEVGDTLYIEKENVGRVILSEYDDYVDNRVKIYKIERLENGKKGLGKSILTILSRVCKGNDIIIELTVGDIISGTTNKKLSKLKFNINKLEKYYNKSGFKTNKYKSVEEGMLVLDNEDVVDEYIKRMGWDD